MDGQTRIASKPRVDAGIDELHCVATGCTASIRCRTEGKRRPTPLFADWDLFPDPGKVPGHLLLAQRAREDLCRQPWGPMDPISYGRI